MKPEVASVVQDHAEAFISRVTDNLGASIDVYVSATILYTTPFINRFVFRTGYTAMH